MLYLISLGLYDELDMSLRALHAAKKCDLLYLEKYTTGVDTDAVKLKRLLGKPVREIKREEMEERSKLILNQARTNTVGIFVGGDALVATTHTSLLLDAKKAHIPVQIVHGSSIYSAVSKTGLQIYKFGRTVTLTNPMQPSIYEAIKNNKNAKLHTLILLDIPMTALEGLGILLEHDRKKKGRKIFKPQTEVVAACRLGSKDEAIRYGPISELANMPELRLSPSVIVLPGETHFMEKEYLETFKTSRVASLESYIQETKAAVQETRGAQKPEPRPLLSVVSGGGSQRSLTGPSQSKQGSSTQ